MLNEIDIYFNDKVVGKISYKMIGGYITSEIKEYNGFSEYLKCRLIESFGKTNYSEWNY